MLIVEEMPARLAAFLASEEPDATDIEVVGYEVMTGGYSRLLAKATVEWTVGGERRTSSFVLRGDPPPERSLIFTERTTEFAVLRGVEGRTPVSPARYLDPTGEHLGTKAVVLDYLDVDSLLPHMAALTDHSHLVRPLAEAAASFHSIPLEDLPSVLARPASYDAYLDDRIDEWRRTALAYVEDLPVLRYVAAWLMAHKPPPVPLGLVHGDFQSSNLMIDGDGRMVVLDWELAQIGDPREDLGYFSAVAQIAPPDLVNLDAEAFCARYRELTGFDESQVNPAVVAYFLILGVVGTVRRLLEGAADYARGKNTLLASVFNVNSVQFGQSVWLPVSMQLEAAFEAMKGAAE
jgi:aminoglycoside phosphotransferase (APT) family kinase protein